MAGKITKHIPNTITLCNLLAGCVAIFMAFRLGDEFCGLPAIYWCWIAIGAAALFDFCDGASARLLGAYSELGKQLDSLSDLVSFGVAPGMLILNIMADNAAAPLLAAFALLIPAFGAYRLAKFNIDDTQTTTFRGLPIPANAIFWVGLSDWILRYGYPSTGVMIALIFVIAGGMVTSVRMFSLKFHNFDWRENFRRYVLIIAAVVFIIFRGVSGLMWTIVLYILISLLGRKDTDTE